MTRPTATKIILVAGILIVFLVACFFIWLFYGIPIHDFRLWLLEQQFIYAGINHPEESTFLVRKSYLGGKSTHGDGVCIYAVGEVRDTSLEENEIRQAYEHSDTSLPIKLFFADADDWAYELPFVIWSEELEDMTSIESTVYMVYIATEHHFLGDNRCDD